MIPTTPTPVTVKDGIANPAPLGLCAFGMTTVLLNLKNAGIIEVSSMILAMGIFYGGIAQVIAGYIEAKKNNIFGLTAFISYGFFWLALVGLIVIPSLGWIPKASGSSMAAFLGVWALFSFLMFFGTLKLSRALQFIFGTLTLLLIMLAVSAGTGNEELEKIAGFEGIICGASAIYTGMAVLLNEVYGKTVLPIGPVA
jgi:succinate-acetate transporter protein